MSALLPGSCNFVRRSYHLSVKIIDELPASLMDSARQALSVTTKVAVLMMVPSPQQKCKLSCLGGAGSNWVYDCRSFKCF